MEKKSFSDQELTHVLEYISGLKVPSSVSKEGAWKNLQYAILKEEEKMFSEKPVRQFSWQGLLFRYGIAALVLLLAGIVFFYRFFGMKEYETLKGRQMSFYLPDGSFVKLNSSSKLTYQPYQWYRQRKVFLEGEAYFKVEKGASFSVHCQDISVRVLGTIFNVSSRNHRHKVECITGKVKVTTPQMEKVITPGEAIVYHAEKDSISAYTFDPLKGGSWIHGEFYFTHEPLEEVFAEIERQYDVVIDYSTSSLRFYSGYFNVHQPLEKTLDMVCLPMNLRYEVSQSGRVRISP